MRVLILSKGAIERVTANRTAQQTTVEQANGFAHALFTEIMRRKGEPTEEENRYSGAILALHLGRTKAYEMAKSEINNAHFILVRYRSAETGEFWLRTTGAIAFGQMQPAHIESLANQVLATDRQRCPERFARATVLQFRAR